MTIIINYQPALVHPEYLQLGFKHLGKNCIISSVIFLMLNNRYHNDSQSISYMHSPSRHSHIQVIILEMFCRQTHRNYGALILAKLNTLIKVQQSYVLVLTTVLIPLMFPLLHNIDIHCILSLPILLIVMVSQANISLILIIA